MPISDIVVKGARVNNLKNIDVAIPRKRLVPASRRLPSTRSMPRAGADMWRACRPMPASLWASCASPSAISFAACHRP